MGIPLVDRKNAVWNRWTSFARHIKPLFHRACIICHSDRKRLILCIGIREIRRKSLTVVGGQRKKSESETPTPGNMNMLFTTEKLVG